MVPMHSSSVRGMQDELHAVFFFVNKFVICHWVLTSLLSLHSSYRVAILNKKSKV